ncbi:MAG: xanthine dehydrogenase accessory protein XdhC [Pseudomonadota bacterium]
MTQALIDALVERLAHEPAVLVTVDSTQGSVPRETGAWMGVFAGADIVGTVGGGHLEFEAIDIARRALSGQAVDKQRRFALGPSLGQCCGGVVHLRFALLGAADAAALRARLEAEADARRLPVALFGGGHVGRAIVHALLPLPVRVHWIDSRDEVFPDALPRWISIEHSAPVHAAVSDLTPRSRVLIMSFSHAEDLDIVAACLQRQRERADLPFIGLIGSQSKWASFRHRLEARGFSESELAQVRCPIGVAGVVGKEPAVIAAAVAAQLMQLR